MRPDEPVAGGAPTPGKGDIEQELQALQALLEDR
jgi:hypothetical protein